MGSYFKPLRRKFGIVALVIATAFTGLWLRSFGRTDAWIYFLRTPSKTSTSPDVATPERDSESSFDSSAEDASASSYNPLSEIELQFYEEYEYAIRSLPDGLNLGFTFHPDSDAKFESGWFSRRVDENVLRLARQRSERPDSDIRDNERRWRFCGFEYYGYRTDGGHNHRSITITPLSIAIPMTFLAAYLLLSKPRVKRAAPELGHA